MVAAAKVVGTELLQRRINRLFSALKRPASANRAASAQLYSWTIRNFDSEGGLIGGWLPVSEATFKRKQREGKEKILVRTGELRASILPFHDATDAGIGTATPYAAVHQFGSATVPARPFLPDRDTALGIGINVYGHYIEREIATEGLR